MRKNLHLLSEKLKISLFVVMFLGIFTFACSTSDDNNVVEEEEEEVVVPEEEIVPEEDPSNAIRFDVSDKRQPIDMIGGDMERSQSNLINAGDPEQVARWCFEDIKFTVCRVSYDKKQESTEGTKNFAFYDDAVWAMQLIKSINPDIKFWATMKSDYNGYNSSSNLPDWICDYNPTTWFDWEKYGIFLADYLEYMEGQGVPISYISTAKEWTSVVTPVRSKMIIQQVISECEERNITLPLFTDPASWSITQGVNWVKQVDAVASADLYHSFSTHNLDTSEDDYNLYEEFVAETSKLNKPAYCDETSAGSGGSNDGVESTTMKSMIRELTERTEFYKDGINGEIVFEIFSRGYNNENRAIYFQNGGEARRTRSYYVMKTFMNSLGVDKYYIPSIDFEIAENVYSMAFANDDELFVTLINNNEEELEDFTLQVRGGDSDTTASIVLYEIPDPDDVYLNIAGDEKTAEVVDNNLVYTIPASSIMFFVFPLI